MTVAALYVAADSVYKTLPGVDCWDAERDARCYMGPWPVVAHPPCRGWSRLRAMSKAPPDEVALGPLAVHQVRYWGGVLEHPAGSSLWPWCRLPEPGQWDRHGFCLGVPQFWWGHRAEKRTLLYICGVEPRSLPAVPLVLGEASHVLGLYSGRDRSRSRPDLPKRERAATPLAFARWLVDVAIIAGLRSPCQGAA